jgi:hypothetical protein
MQELFDAFMLFFKKERTVLLTTRPENQLKHTVSWLVNTAPPLNIMISRHERGDV